MGGAGAGTGTRRRDGSWFRWRLRRGRLRRWGCCRRRGFRDQFRQHDRLGRLRCRRNRRGRQCWGWRWADRGGPRPIQKLPAVGTQPRAEVFDRLRGDHPGAVQPGELALHGVQVGQLFGRGGPQVATTPLAAVLAVRGGMAAEDALLFRPRRAVRPVTARKIKASTSQIPCPTRVTIVSTMVTTSRMIMESDMANPRSWRPGWQDDGNYNPSNSRLQGKAHITPATDSSGSAWIAGRVASFPGSAWERTARQAPPAKNAAGKPCLHGTADFPASASAPANCRTSRDGRKTRP